MAGSHVFEEGKGCDSGIQDTNSDATICKRYVVHQISPQHRLHM